MSIHSILALTDFSTSGEHALDRAALLAVAHRASLRVMYFDEKPHPGIAHPEARLAQRARQLARRHQIAVQAVARGTHDLDAVVDEACGADLLVLDPRRQWTWSQLWRGPFTDQLMRRCACPVLVVRRPARQPYGHVLVAVDFSPQSRALVRYAGSLGAAAELQLFHALSTSHASRMRSAQVSADVIQAYRQDAQRSAHVRIVRLRDSLDTRRTRVLSVIGDGDPARQTAVQQEATGADLVVVGKRRGLPLVDLLLGSVAQRLVYWSSGDVLAVPHDHRPRSVGAAKMRLLPAGG